MLTLHHIKRNPRAVELPGEYFDIEVWPEHESEIPDWIIVPAMVC